MDDPERMLLGRLLKVLHAHFGGGAVMVKEMIARAHDRTKPGSDELLEVLQDITEETSTINRRKLGRWILRHAGEIVGGLKLVESTSTRNSRIWKIESL